MRRAAMREFVLGIIPMKRPAPIEAVVSLMLFIMATILMIQLQSFHRLFLVFAVAPLAVIGVVMALLPSGAPLGFVAILGVLALIGILIRNSVILIVQIEDLRKAGRPAWDAVVEATEHRMRPIMLTAAAASLALIPIAREIFWGPMAYAMMGGIIVGTLLTLLFLPALYVAGSGSRSRNPIPIAIRLPPICMQISPLTRPLSAHWKMHRKTNMKEVLSLFTFGIGALCFVVFVTVFKPDAVSAVPGPTKPDYCNTEASPTHACRLHVFAGIPGAADAQRK